MVVGIHAGLPVESQEAVSYLFRNGLFRIAVPIFFIINGFYLTGALASRPSMLIWSRRMLGMYAFWMLLYLPFYFPEQYTLKAFISLVVAFVFGYFHLWYIISLLMAGWLLYLLRNISPRLLLTAAVALFLIGTAVQYYAAYREVRIPIWIYRGPLLLAFPMVVVGYLLRQVALARFQVAAWMALAGGCALLLLESWLSYGALDGRARMDLMLGLIILCPAVFVLTVSRQGGLNSDHPAKLSSAIYFCHPLFIWISRKYFGTGWGPSTSVVTLVLCLLAYYPLYLLSKRYRFIF
jgi:hypothetical protein